MNELMKVMREPEYTSQKFIATVSMTFEISGKSILTLYNGISLLKLPDEIQAEIRAGNLPVSQGYLFAANLERPDRVKAVNEKPSFNMDNIG